MSRRRAMMGGRTLPPVQLIDNGNFESTRTWSLDTGVSYTVGENAATVAYLQSGSIYQTPGVTTGRSYLILMDVKTEYSGVFESCFAPYPPLVSDGAWHTYSKISVSDETVVKGFAAKLTEAGTAQVRNAMVIDLTATYGAGNEPETVAAFKADYPLDYYPYNPMPNYGGIEIFFDKASYSFNGKVTDYSRNELMFISALVDSGNTNTKSITFGYSGWTLPTGFQCTARLFNNPSEESVDFWPLNAGGKIRTVDFVGRYYAFTIVIDKASKFYAYDNTNARYLLRGDEV